MPVAARGSAEGSSEQVVAFVWRLIERGRLKPGDRLPAERDLATRIGVSRPTVRAGLRALAAMGVVRSKHGSGTYIPRALRRSGPSRSIFSRRCTASPATKCGRRGASWKSKPRGSPPSARRTSSMESGRGSGWHVRQPRQPAAVSRARHQLPPRRRRRGEEPNRRDPRRHGLGDVLRAAQGNGDPRLGQRSARRRRSAPPHLPGD